MYYCLSWGDQEPISTIFPAERLDLYVGPEECADNEAEDASKLPFEYLGYITLNDNESTEFKSRELKSITVPPFSPTLYVKLRLYQNHQNSLNIYNQVILKFVCSGYRKIYP